jgi:hypothetical protein
MNIVTLIAGITAIGLCSLDVVCSIDLVLLTGQGIFNVNLGTLCSLFFLEGSFFFKGSFFFNGSFFLGVSTPFG